MNAVVVRGVVKCYGNKKDEQRILNYLNMTVKYGSIYALIGPSGCGKTTLLSAIVNAESINEGSIDVLSELQTHVSRHRIGFMPQKTSLIDEFTIKEVIYYFGRIYGMSNNKIIERLEFICKLLDLNSTSIIIGNCSGGQQRRISLAVSMLHDPEILILDEPTVGLDALLRQKIWNFLNETTEVNNTTVIITTHYIEEAKKADYVGMMRNGVLVAEDKPENILRQFQVETLEQVFLQLSSKQEQSHFMSSVVCAENICNDKSIREKSNQRVELNRHFQALILKNLLQIVRQPFAALFLIFLPMISTIIFHNSVCDTFVGLKIGIVSDELTSYGECFNNSLKTVMWTNESCELTKISCRFIALLDVSLATKIFINSSNEAYERTKRGNIMGFVYFAPNFTQSMLDIWNNKGDAPNGSFDNSKIQITLDNVNRILYNDAKRKFLELFEVFIKELFQDCHLEPKCASLPIEMMRPLFGADLPYKETLSPGIMMMFLFIMSSLSASIVFLRDRLEGIWNRTLICGIKTEHILLSHLLSQTMIVSLSLVVTVVIVNIFYTEHSYNLTACTLMLLFALTGTVIGFLVSLFSDSFSVAHITVVSLFIPTITLGGYFWPIEGMSHIFKYIAYILPFTLPSMAIKNIVIKNYSIMHQSVLIAYGVTLFWTIFIIFILWFSLKCKKYSRQI